MSVWTSCTLAGCCCALLVVQVWMPAGNSLLLMLPCGCAPVGPVVRITQRNKYCLHELQLQVVLEACRLSRVGQRALFELPGHCYDTLKQFG